MTLITRFLKDESGMETIEYALIAGLIAIVALFIYNGSWKTTLSNRLNTAASSS